MEKAKIDILLVEDNPADVIFLGEALAQDALATFQLTTVESLAEALEHLKAHPFEAILLDLGLPDSQGLPTFLSLHQAAPELPVVVLSALDDEEVALQALQAGAQDYLVKRPREFPIAGRAMRYAIERQKSEKRFHTVFHASPTPQFITHLETERILDVNEAYAKMMGYEREEMLGRTTLELGLWKTPEAHAKVIQTLQAHDRVRDLEIELQTRRGEARIVIVSAERIELHGEMRLLSSTVDVTERKAAEQDAAYRQKLLEKIIQLGKKIASITDLEQCLQEIYHSARFGLGFERVGLYLYDQPRRSVRKAYGTSRSGETQGPDHLEIAIENWRNWELALQPPTGLSFIEDFQKAIDPPETHEMYGVGENATIAAWAGEKPVALLTADNLLTGKKITPADLEALQLFAGYAGLAIENARMHTGLELKVQERTAEIQAIRQRLELAAQTARLGVWEWNIKTGQLLWDEQVYTIYGLPQDTFQVSLESFLAIIHPDDLASLMQLTQKALANKPAGQIEYRVRRDDGSIGYVKAHGTIRCDAEGQPESIIGVVQDITPEKLAENALRESEAKLRASRDQLSVANAALEKAARMKDEFLASMSHELRTPLTSILGLSEAMQLDTYGILTEKQNKAVQIIEGSGRHLLALINDILDLSKIEAGMLELNIEPVELADICQASLQLIKGMARKKEQSVKSSITPNTIDMCGDARRLKQMLVNLLSNAIKFTPENGSLGLEVQADKTEQVIRLTVWDTGIGIAPENLEKLFQPFVQLESHLARQYTGTGLGLALVQRMAELHGGGIQVESALGQGSRFTIVLPWKPVETQPIPLSNRGAKFFHKALIVDDREIDAGQLSRYLHVLGMQTTIHATGQGAVEMAAGEKPDLILLDLHLPDRSGFEVLAELKANPVTCAIPVVICSVEERHSQAIAQGAVGYLVKPLTITDLRKEIDRVASKLDQGPGTSPIPSSARPLVLIVDDNEVLIEAICDYLESQNFQVVAARSGVEMLETAPELHPDIILMDIQMPGMDGLEATRRVRAHPDPRVSRAPIIALTALVMSGDRERCLAAGANAYMSKPFGLKQLMGAIRDLLDGMHSES